MTASLSLNVHNKEGSYVCLISKDFEGTEGAKAYNNVIEVFEDSIITINTSQNLKKKNYVVLNLMAIAKGRPDGRISAAPTSPTTYFDKKRQKEIVEYIRSI